MDNSHSQAGQHPSAALPSGRKANAKYQRRYVRTMAFSIFFVAVLIGGVAAISAIPRTASEEAADNSVSAAPANATGTIVLHPGAGCQSKIFDNRTGQISDRGTPCPVDTPVDAKGVPVPLGTVHTMSSISKSFK